MKAIMPRPRSNQVVVFHPLIRFGEARDKPNNIKSGLEVKSRAFKGVALVHVDHIMPGEPQAQMLVKSINAT